MAQRSAEYPNFDGLSSARASRDIDRQPNSADWDQLVAEVLAIQADLAAWRAIPTSDQNDSSTIWNDNGVLKVSTAP